MKLGMCVSVGRHPDGLHRFPSGRCVPMWCIKVYKAEQRKKDGKYTWRVHEMKQPVTAYQIPDSLERDAREYANRLGMTYLPDIKQGSEVKLSELEMLALALGE